MNAKDPSDWLRLLVFLALGVLLAGALFAYTGGDVTAILSLVAFVAVILAMYSIGKKLFSSDGPA